LKEDDRGPGEVVEIQQRLFGKRDISALTLTDFHFT